MIELDEIGELAWLPFVMLAALMVCRGGQAGPPGRWLVAQAGSAFRRVQGAWRDGSPGGNQSFDAYRNDALRKLEEDEREFRAFLQRLRQARGQAEFEAFVAERAR